MADPGSRAATEGDIMEPTEQEQTEYDHINSNVGLGVQPREFFGSKSCIPEMNVDPSGFPGSRGLGSPVMPFVTPAMLDPTLRQPYAMPPAGLQVRRSNEQLSSSPSRKYNMASDIFGNNKTRGGGLYPPPTCHSRTGMDKSWAAGSPNPRNSASDPTKVPTPASFKITETTSSSSSPSDGYSDHSDQSQMAPGNRRARDSTGNPLTGAGYDEGNNKTAKRYFEGSNANQKLW